MTSAVEVVVSPVSQIQYPAKRFLAPLPLSLFGELEDDSNNDNNDTFSDVKLSTSTALSTTAASISPPDLVRGKEEEEFGDFEDEFGDFESVPADSSVRNAASEPSTDQRLDLQAARTTLTDIGTRSEVTHDFITDFRAVAVPSAPAVSKSRAVAEEDLFGNLEAVVSVPQIEVSQANRPIYDFFGRFESPAIPHLSEDAKEKRPEVNLSTDFASLSVNETDRAESSSDGAIAFEGFLPSTEKTIQIEPTVGKNTAFRLFEDFGSNAFFDVPKRGAMNGFDDLFGGFKAPLPVNTQSSLSFSDESFENSLGSVRRDSVDHSGFDPLGVFDFSSAEKKPDVHEVIFFSPKAQANTQENGGISDDDWGDFVAPPPPVAVTSVKREEGSPLDSLTVGSTDVFLNGDFGEFDSFGLPGKHEEIKHASTTQASGFLDSWEAELLNAGPGLAKTTSGNGEVIRLELEKTQTSEPVKVNASSFYEAQVSQFFPTSTSGKPQKDKDSRRSRSVDLDALYANPDPVVKTRNRVISSVEKSAAPLSLSIFGEEEDASTEAAELSLGSSLNGFVGSGRQQVGDSLDEFAESSSSDSQDETDVDADEFFLSKADDLHKLTLWLLEEGRVQEALACTAHTTALLEFQALQEDCSRALESGDLDKASVITSKIEAAHAKLAQPQDWHKWQKRQRHENGIKHGSSPVVPKLTHEDMMSLLGGLSDQRGVYFLDHFQSSEIDSLAKKDLRAAAEHHTRALETFHLLISATVEEQLLYVKAWSALASSCASELELGMIFWQRAVQAHSQSHLLTHRKGRNYFAALGQVYCVYLILDATARLHASWLEVAGEKGKAIHRLMDQCRSCWNGSGLKDAVYWALSEANDSLPSTNTSWQAILDLSIAVNLASLKHSKGGEQPVCGLSLLPLQTLPGVATVEWAGRQYFLQLANMQNVQVISWLDQKQLHVDMMISEKTLYGTLACYRDPQQ
ncbi:hypothetical protein R1flu_013214 [Riccia fluitans]|uniref:Synergin gamma C-terminal domain-containing protein n=1 Tax=Riccia fluitans TaxID=41844 RepID=A0ABD1YCP9_9MARC